MFKYTTLVTCFIKLLAQLRILQRFLNQRREIGACVVEHISYAVKVLQDVKILPCLLKLLVCAVNPSHPVCYVRASKDVVTMGAIMVHTRSKEAVYCTLRRCRIFRPNKL